MKIKVEVFSRSVVFFSLSLSHCCYRFFSDNDRESSDWTLLHFSRIRFVNMPTACYVHETVAILLSLSLSLFLSFSIKLDEEKKKYSNKKKWRKRERAANKWHRRKKCKKGNKKRERKLDFTIGKCMFILHTTEINLRVLLKKKNRRKIGRWRIVPTYMIFNVTYLIL